MQRNSAKWEVTVIGAGPYGLCFAPLCTQTMGAGCGRFRPVHKASRGWLSSADGAALSNVKAPEKSVCVLGERPLSGLRRCVPHTKEIQSARLPPSLSCVQQKTCHHLEQLSAIEKGELKSSWSNQRIAK